MNVLKLPALLFLLGTTFAGTGAWAQSSLHFQAETTLASVSSASRPAAKTGASSSSAFRFFKRLPQAHSGYLIEVATSNFPLTSEHPVFKKYGNVFYDKLREGGYSYLIKADFSSKEAVQEFLQKVILPKTPEARFVEYKEGIRTVVRD